jgi:hypothetical protein
MLTYLVNSIPLLFVDNLILWMWKDDTFLGFGCACSESLKRLMTSQWLICCFSRFYLGLQFSRLLPNTDCYLHTVMCPVIMFLRSIVL